MSESPACKQLSEWLFEGKSAELTPQRAEHMDTCAGCREQWHAHQSLVAAFANAEVPELSPAFDAALERKLKAAPVEIRPLRGWRTVAMIVYSAAAIGIVGWALRDISLPTIDLSAPWVPIAVFIAVPLTFMLAIAVSRWLPAPASPRGLQVFSV
jgi:hypothetical protein